MKCSKCGTELKRSMKFCGNCGAAQSAAAPSPSQSRSAAGVPPKNVYYSDTTAEPFWKPDWKWHAKALGIIFVFLCIVFVALNAFLSRVPEPYRMRDVPQDVTPWLKK
jgi:hypothetical protein